MFNFSYEQPLTVLQLVDTLLEVMGSSLEPDVRNEASNEIRDQYLDATQGAADARTGRRPSRSRRRCGETVDWYKRYWRVADARIPVVILCGGAGTRLSEQTEVRPKPLVEIGGRPIVWHIMKHYSRYGFNEFVLALGYKGDQIKRYFLGLSRRLAGHHRQSRRRQRVADRRATSEPWTVHLVDTGESTLTGGRLRQLEPHRAATARSC